MFRCTLIFLFTLRPNDQHQNCFLPLLLESPKVTVTPYKSRVKIGEPAEFTCLASGSPSPDLSWRKLNGLLPAGSTEQGGVLRIVNVTENEPGTYVCDATNVEGSANSSAVLEIKGSLYFLS